MLLSRQPPATWKLLTDPLIGAIVPLVLSTVHRVIICPARLGDRLKFILATFKGVKTRRRKQLLNCLLEVILIIVVSVLRYRSHRNCLFGWKDSGLVVKADIILMALVLGVPLCSVVIVGWPKPQLRLVDTANRRCMATDGFIAICWLLLIIQVLVKVGRQATIGLLRLTMFCLISRTVVAVATGPE